jgi:putative flippase GtrA
MNQIAILIPTYKPDETLIRLVCRLREVIPGSPFVIVRDGVLPDNKPIFDQLEKIQGVFILSHAVNLGKGRALKTAFNKILTDFPECSGVVTADADGQHLPEDILKVAQMVQEAKALVLGSRFSVTHHVPWKSRIGNSLTRLVFRVLIGLNLRDTQTGLRGIPRRYLGNLMQTYGERYEFETNMLISAKQNHWPVTEVGVETVYLNQNRGSHFNPLLDSMRIYFLLIRFFLSSIAASVVDFGAFSILTAGGASLSTAVVVSRAVSATFNYLVNRKIVFRDTQNLLFAGLKYWVLVVVILAMSYLGTEFLFRLGLNLYLSKLSVDGSLFVFSFLVQRDLVFKRRTEAD